MIGTGRLVGIGWLAGTRWLGHSLGFNIGELTGVPWAEATPVINCSAFRGLHAVVRKKSQFKVVSYSVRNSHEPTASCE